MQPGRSVHLGPPFRKENVNPPHIMVMCSTVTGGNNITMDLTSETELETVTLPALFQPGGLLSLSEYLTA
ncbi:hypothetical protein AAC387_Pa05g3821 [Persea americana]